MTYLLDTCIVSKMRRLKAHPDQKLLDWVSKHDEATYYLSVLTLGEIQTGISKLVDQRQKMLLEDWLFGQVIPRFKDRILDITSQVAFTWGAMNGEKMRSGKVVPVIDGLIAATAIQHGLIVVTENQSHFQFFDVQVINPWQL